MNCREQIKVFSRTDYKQCNHSCEEKNVGVLSTHRYLMVFFDIIVDEIEFISVLVDKAPVRLIVQHFQAAVVVDEYTTLW